MKSFLRFASAAFVAFAAMGCSAFPDTPVLPMKTDGTYVSADGKATLIVSNSLRVLTLRGTSYENGFGTGELLAAEIMNAVRKYSFWVAWDLGYDYSSLAADTSIFDWSGCREEMEGMLAGMKSVLTAEQLQVRPYRETEREISLEDLMVLNTLADWACSSFCIWGAGRTGGEALFARNLDYYVDDDETINTLHLVTVYNSAGSPRWVNVSFCGVIGCISGMNASGLCAAIQNTDYYSPTDSSGFVPRTFALRKILESLDTNDTPADAESLLEPIPAFQGNNFILCFPAVGRTDDETAAVIEYDGNAGHPDGRATWRKPSDNSSLPVNEYFNQTLDYAYAIINVNHYLKRRTEAPAYGDDSGWRYVTVKSLLATAKSDGNVTVAEARDIMTAVGHIGTLQTLVFEPDAGKFRVYLARPGLAAFDSPAYDLSLGTLTNG